MTRILNLTIIWITFGFAPFLQTFALADNSTAPTKIIGPEVVSRISDGEQARIIEEGKKLLQQQIQYLASLGVEASPEDMEYLALEVFYNIPTFPSVLGSNPQQMGQEKILYLAVSNQLIHKTFPKNLNDGKHHKLNLEMIKISGHDSWFAWDTKEKVALILKHTKRTTGARVSILLFGALEKHPEIDIDFVPEYSPPSHPYEILRPLRSYKQKDGEILVPLHGVFGSYKIHELARNKGLSTFDYIETILIPKLADTVYESVFKLGLLFGIHTQNLWLAIDSNGDIRIVIKDLQDAESIPLAAIESTRGMHSELLGNIPRANLDYTPENPKNGEPGFHFASYLFQTIAKGMVYTPQEQARLFASFFNRLTDRLENDSEIKIHWTEQTKKILSRFKDMSHDIDLKVPPSKSYQTIFDKYVGLRSLSGILMEEILGQVYVARIGKLHQPKNKTVESILKSFVGNQWPYYALAPLTPTPFAIEPCKDDPVTKIKNKIIRRINRLRGTQSFFEDRLKELKASTDVRGNGKFTVLQDKKTGQPLFVQPVTRKCLEDLRAIAEVKKMIKFTSYEDWKKQTKGKTP